MKLRVFLSALFRFRNISALLLSIGAVYLFDPVIDSMLAGQLGGTGAEAVSIMEAGTVAVLYLSFVVQSLMSKQFHEDFNKREKIRSIQDLNFACRRLANDAKKHVNSVYLQKLRKVMEDKNEIVNSFFRGEHSYIKERIVEQTLNLVVAYSKLLLNFCIRSRELSGMDVGEIANRINTNTRKLNFTKDPHMAEDIRSLISMDEKIISRLKEEKRELERISAKLDYMESTVGMFKHQILSSIESEEMIEQLETAVNEATALDNVLQERRKNRMSM